MQCVLLSRPESRPNFGNAAAHGDRGDSSIMSKDVDIQRNKMATLVLTPALEWCSLLLRFLGGDAERNDTQPGPCDRLGWQISTQASILDYFNHKTQAALQVSRLGLGLGVPFPSQVTLTQSGSGSGWHAATAAAAAAAAVAARAAAVPGPLPESRADVTVILRVTP